MLLRLTTIILCALACSTAADTIRLRADAWMPFNGEPNAKKPGYIIEIANKAWKEAGHNVDYQLQPWEKALLDVHNGKADCAVGVYKPEAPDLIFHQHSLGNDSTSYYSFQPELVWKYESPQSFHGYTLGVIAGYGYKDNITNYINEQLGSHNNTAAVYVATGEAPLEELIRQAIAGKVDIILANPLVFKYTVRKLWLSNHYKKLDEDTNIVDLFIGCDPNNPKSQSYVDLIDATLLKLRKSGQLEHIISAYGIQDWQPSN